MASNKSAPTECVTRSAHSIAFLLALATSCKRAPAPTPDEPASVDSALVAVSAAPSAGASRPPAGPQLVKLERFAPAGVSPSALYAIEGALMVSAGFRVGRIAGDAIEWIGAIPASTPALGPNELHAVEGRWPEPVFAIYMSTHGRAPLPTAHLLKGSGGHTVFGDGGGAAWISGMARIGETTLIAGFNGFAHGMSIATGHGPTLERRMKSMREGGCTPEEIGAHGQSPAFFPAVSPDALRASPAGTLISVGAWCGKRGPAAEVWDGNGKSRIVDLSRWFKDHSSRSSILAGGGDELWVVNSSPSNSAAVLRYAAGNFEPVASPPTPVRHAFVSQTGALHASDGQTIYRFEDRAWRPVFHFAWPGKRLSFALDERGALWASTGSAVYRARESEGPSIGHGAGCPTPFVYLYDVSPTNAKDFTFPTTRRALASFDGAADLELVEFEAQGERRLGVVVKSAEQGEALIAHVNKTMKDEAPKLVCYVPDNSRKIDIKAALKGAPIRK